MRDKLNNDKKEQEMKKELTCIVCPTGCSITVELDDNKNVVSVNGNSCKRGEKYASEEVSAPKRTLTALVRVENGITRVTSVKTSTSIPKEMINDIIEEIGNIKLTAPVEIGDVVLSNVLNSGADIVVTRRA